MIEHQFNSWISLLLSCENKQQKNKQKTQTCFCHSSTNKKKNTPLNVEIVICKH